MPYTYTAVDLSEYLQIITSANMAAGDIGMFFAEFFTSQKHQSLDFIEAYVHDSYDLTTQGICKKAGVQLFFYGGNNYNRVNKR